MQNRHGRKSPGHTNPRDLLRTEPTATVGTMPRVQIPHSGEFKFVEFEGPDHKSYVYGNSNGNHPTQVEEFVAKAKKLGLDSEEFKIRGGGFILIDEDKKEVFIGGHSGTYGAFSPYAVRALREYISEHMPDFSVK